MFKKVLVVDDLGSINEGVASVLKALQIPEYDLTLYCDNAYLKLKSAQQNDKPYDLLITDLSFKKDYKEQRFKSGESLIQGLREEGFCIKIIVYSVEERYQRIRSLIKDRQVNAYVSKGRQGLSQLKMAIKSINNDKLYISPNLQPALNSKNDLEITDYDIALLRQLSLGKVQKSISNYFSSKGISPSSLSSIEKRINKLCDNFNAQNTTHLISIAKDMGLI